MSSWPAAWVPIVAGVAFVASGVVAWRSSPRRPIGPLLVVEGLLWTLHQFPPPVPRELLALTAGAWPALLAHLVMAFPTGRLPDGASRLVAGLGYLCVAAMGLRHLAGPPVREAIAGAGTLMLVVVGGAVIALQAARLRRSSTARRRALLPVLAAAVVATALFVVWKPVAVALAAGTSLVGAAGQPAVDAGAPALALSVQVALAAIPLAFLWSLLRRRIDRGGVAGLVVRLSKEPRSATLQAALAETLHDPTLRVGYWVPESGGYLDVGGELVREGPGQAVTRVDGDGPLAVLTHDPALLEDPDLIEAACAAVSLALENERLTAELRARLRQLAESRAQVVRAAEAERRRLERDLHDGVQQRLLSIPLTLSLAEAALSSGAERTRPLIAEARNIALTTLGEVRALAQGIHPPILTERGLAGAVHELAAVAPVPVTISSDVPGDLPAEIETTAYYVVAEALSNLAKHAAAGRAEVRIGRADGLLTVEVRDDGRGGADPERGSGLRGLADRVETNGGSLRVHSPPGRGTWIEARLPCA
ncbi:sensor histidine kinase [Nonomuraea diastatica]|uniref:sensor histidine kinase n=1 Tax=Nonomuraea diastatica TaxID=1848329 RepID=UPI00140E177D|nr:sensor histidine kinase [Nonomuraea diastatica]